MQKVINLLAVVSFGVSASIVGGGLYVYNQKDSIIESVKENITNQIQGIVGGALVGGLNSPMTEVPEAEALGGSSLPSLPF